MYLRVYLHSKATTLKKKLTHTKSIPEANFNRGRKIYIILRSKAGQSPRREGFGKLTVPQPTKNNCTRCGLVNSLIYAKDDKFRNCFTLQCWRRLARVRCDILPSKRNPRSGKRTLSAGTRHRRRTVSADRSETELHYHKRSTTTNRDGRARAQRKTTKTVVHLVKAGFH